MYGEAKSQIHALRDVPRIVGTLGRLTLERLAPPPALRAAARAVAAERGAGHAARPGPGMGGRAA